MASTQAFVGRSQTVSCRAKPAARRATPVTITCSATPCHQSPALAQQQVSRRNVGAVLTALSVGALWVSAPPAKAFLGFGEDATAEYEKSTAAVLGNVKVVLEMPKDAEGKEDTVKELRKEINTWVAKYRRDPTFAGRPSYGNTYSILNALAGHFNSFGPTAPIPKKRLDRIKKELDDAERLLARGR